MAYKRTEDGLVSLVHQTNRGSGSSDVLTLPEYKTTAEQREDIKNWHDQIDAKQAELDAAEDERDKKVSNQVAALNQSQPILGRALDDSSDLELIGSTVRLAQGGIFVENGGFDWVGNVDFETNNAGGFLHLEMLGQFSGGVKLSIDSYLNQYREHLASVYLSAGKGKLNSQDSDVFFYRRASNDHVVMRVPLPSVHYSTVAVDLLAGPHYVGQIISRYVSGSEKPFKIHVSNQEQLA